MFDRPQGDLDVSSRRDQDRQSILDLVEGAARWCDRHNTTLTSHINWPKGANQRGSFSCPTNEFSDNNDTCLADALPKSAHYLANLVCEIDGDTAYCETYVIVVNTAGDGRTCTLSAGRYIDRLERHGDTWSIFSRQSTVKEAMEGDTSWLLSPAMMSLLESVQG